VNDPSINAFVAEGQNMFINTGLIMALDTPNQVTGVMAHETGTWPTAIGTCGSGHEGRHRALALSMAAGLAAMLAGAGDAGQAILLGGQQIAERPSGLQPHTGSLGRSGRCPVSQRHPSIQHGHGRGLQAL
jgi:predicted Zn-dependent protease